MAKDERLNQAFGLIGQGNQHEEESDFWKAANCFGDAMRLLFELAVELDPKTDDEQKIGDLYQTQCREYLHRGRSAFVQALSKEDEADQSDKDEDPKFITLTQEEAKQRVQLFSTLFSKELELNVEDLMAMPDPKEIEEHQSSLENRLRSLNDSISPAMKTEEERMKDIDKGLKGLGLNLYSNTKKTGLDLDVPVSKGQQMADIMAQAKDEANYEMLHGIKDDDDSVILTDESSIDDEEEDEIDLDDDADSFIPKLRNKKAIRKHAVNAQVKLAQLIALLDEEKKEPTAKKGGAEKDDEDDDDDNDLDEEGRSPAEKVQFDLDHGKMLLLKAKKNLAKAVESWEVEL